MVWFNYPAETYATPRLRPKVQLPVTADAIGYLRTANLEYADEQQKSIGFVYFK
jgi:hypothetical protein